MLAGIRSCREYRGRSPLKSIETKWRAGQNKTANTYVIEIAFDPKPASQPRA